MPSIDSLIFVVHFLTSFRDFRRRLYFTAASLNFALLNCLSFIVTNLSSCGIQVVCFSMSQTKVNINEYLSFAGATEAAARKSLYFRYIKSDFWIFVPFNFSFT